jgi:hypothetical protein
MFNFLKQTKSGENQPQTPPTPGENLTAAIADPPAPVETSPAEAAPQAAETPVVRIPPVQPDAKPTPEPVPAAKPLYPPLPPNKVRRSFFYVTLSSETRMGRFMRPLLRGLAAVTGFFALGLMAGYILIYQPTQRDLDAALVKINQTNQSISLKEQNLQAAQSNSDQAQLNVKQIQAQLSKASSENGLLVVLVGVSNARVSLVNKDGPAAKTILEQAQTDLATILPYLSSIDQNKADLLKSRLDLAVKELVSDPTAAQTDLDKLSVDLADLDKKIFK